MNLQAALDNATELLARLPDLDVLGRRLEQFQAGPVYSGAARNGHVPDPTSVAALNVDPARRDLDTLREGVKVLGEWAEVLMRVAERNSPRREVRACSSCTRVPWATKIEIETRADGSAYYSGLCRACGAFKGQWGRIPPVSVVERWQRGERVSRETVQALLEEAS